jgi:hypothetical protein
MAPHCAAELHVLQMLDKERYGRCGCSAVPCCRAVGLTTLQGAELGRCSNARIEKALRGFVEKAGRVEA